jgi:WD40 repeat protein
MAGVCDQDGLHPCLLARLPPFAIAVAPGAAPGGRSRNQQRSMSERTDSDGGRATTGPAPEGATLDGDARLPVRRAPAPLVLREHRYELGDELARGGLGRVRRARDWRLDGRPVAVKQLLKATPAAARRFRREALLTARLQHPGIVPLHDLGVGDDGEPFYAMKLVAGRSFDQVIADARDLPARVGLLGHVLAVADAIAYAHSEGVIHRDLKPSNVLVGDFGETVVVDWGIAKRIGEPDEDGGGGELAIDLTAAGDVLGTPSYMAPEQARGEPVDERADVYAIGSMLYHALAGSRPYAGTTGEQVLAQVLAGPPPALATRVPGLAPDLAAIVARAMARAPADRYRNGGELAGDLRRYQTGQLVAAHTYSRALRLRRWLARHRAAVAVAAVMATALLGVGALSVRRVVAERDAAASARTVAAGERDRAERRSQELVIAQARSALGRDPTAALAWLAELGAAAGDHATAVAAVSADAASRGVARHVLAGHDGTVNALALSPDGRRLASAADDGTVQVWELGAAPRRIATLPHGIRVLVLAFAGDTLVSGDHAGIVRAWHAGGGWTGRELWRHGGMVHAIHAAGDDLVTGGADGSVRRGRLDGSSEALAGHAGPVVAIGRAAGSLATAGGDGLVRWYAGGAVRALRHPAAVVTMAMAPGGDAIATTGGDGAVRLWSADGAARVLGRQPSPGDIAFSPDGARVAAIDGSGGVVVYEVSGAVRTLPGHGAAASVVVFSRDGRWVASGGGDGAVRLWSVATGAAWTLRGHGGAIQALIAGDPLVSGDRDGAVRVWALPGDDVHRDGIHRGTVRRLASDGAGGVLSGGADGAVHRLTAGGAEMLGALPGSIEGLAGWPGGAAYADDVGRVVIVSGAARRRVEHPGGVAWLAASADGARVATAGNDGAIGIWDVASGGVRWLRGASPLVHVALGPDGAVIAGSEDGAVTRRDLATGASQVIARVPGQVYRTAVSADGAQVAAAGSDGSVVLWTRATGAARIVHRYRRFASAVAFSPDGQWLVSASWDHTARLSPVAGGRDVVLGSHGEQVNAALFAPDGASVITAAEDGALRVWRPDGALLRMLRASDGFITRLVPTADGVAAAGADGAVIRWRQPAAPAAPAVTSARVTAGTVRSPDEAR